MKINECIHVIGTQMVKQTKRKHNVYIDMLKERRKDSLNTFPKAFLAPKPRFHTKISKHSIFLDKLFWEEKLGLEFQKLFWEKLYFSFFPVDQF